MAEAPLKTDLILEGRIARRPVTFVGTLDDGKLTRISGSVTLNVSLSSVLKDLGPDYGEAAKVLTQLVGSGDIVLEKLGAAYRSSGSRSVQVGLMIKFGGSSIQFAMLKGLGEQKGFIVGVDLRSDKLALPGNFLSGLIGDISIGNLGVSYASELFEDVSFLGADAFQDAKQLTLKSPQITGRRFPKGVKFSAEILIGGINLLDQLEKFQSGLQKNIQGAETTTLKISERQPAQNEADEAKEILDKGSTRWIEAKKTIGPLSVRRIGLSYADQKIGIKLDSGLHLSVLTLTLEGLGLSYPITKFPTDAKDIWKNLEFQLDGAAVAFDAGALTIAGGLIKVDAPKKDDASEKDDDSKHLQLDGTLMVRTDVFSFAALGSYAHVNGTHSLFVFAAIQQAIGGPEYFFVMGLAFGFGINRALKLPDIDEVQNFPLVKAATDPGYLGKKLDLREVSNKLGEYIYPSPGDFWIAAGLKFTTYGQIDSFAMLSVSIGTQFEIALLGLAKIRIPRLLPGEQDVPVIAYAELALKVAFTLESGRLSAEARLSTNSYVFTKECKLTGGFAFFVWFGNSEHDGDFVITLGGYHPRFNAPDHYPNVPRLGMHWQVSPNLKITGGVYFALTPTCLMAGGGLSALYQQKGLRAWFDLYAHFFISWKPLHYDAQVGVRIGASYHTRVLGISLTFKIEMGATCHIWGPPFAGKAHVSWTVISFTIYFGASREPKTPDPIDWKDFQRSFLPPAKSDSDRSDPLTITIARGLIKQIDAVEKTFGDNGIIITYSGKSESPKVKIIGGNSGNALKFDINKDKDLLTIRNSSGKDGTAVSSAWDEWKCENDPKGFKIAAYGDGKGDVPHTSNNNVDLVRIYRIVNPHQLSLIVKSAVPSREIAVNGNPGKVTIKDNEISDKPELGIRPMGIVKNPRKSRMDNALKSSMHVDIVSEAQVKVRRKEEKEPRNDRNLLAESIKQNVAGALWSDKEFKPEEDQKPELIQNAMTGIQLKAADPDIEDQNSLTISDLSQMYHDFVARSFEWHYPRAGTTQDPGDYSKKVKNHLHKPFEMRDKIIQDLAQKNVFEPHPEVEIKADEAAAEIVLQDTPQECGLGMLSQDQRD